MALSMKKLQKLLANEGIICFQAPDRPLLLFHGKGQYGAYQVFIGLHEDGQFLQFRTFGYLNVPEPRSHLPAVLLTLCSLNFELRLVKFGWDDPSGEIVAYADHIVMNGDVTGQQFQRMLQYFLGAIDLNYPRIRATAETGTDPGPMSPTGPQPPAVDRI